MLRNLTCQLSVNNSCLLIDKLASNGLECAGDRAPHEQGISSDRWLNINVQYLLEENNISCKLDRGCVAPLIEAPSPAVPQCIGRSWPYIFKMPPGVRMDNSHVANSQCTARPSSHGHDILDSPHSTVNHVLPARCRSEAEMYFCRISY